MKRGRMVNVAASCRVPPPAQLLPLVRQFFYPCMCPERNVHDGHRVYLWSTKYSPRRMTTDVPSLSGVGRHRGTPIQHPARERSALRVPSDDTVPVSAMRAENLKARLQRGVHPIRVDRDH